jgi:hypothetical protein
MKIITTSKVPVCYLDRALRYSVRDEVTLADDTAVMVALTRAQVDAFVDVLLSPAAKDQLPRILGDWSIEFAELLEEMIEAGVLPPVEKTYTIQGTVQIDYEIKEALYVDAKSEEEALEIAQGLIEDDPKSWIDSDSFGEVEAKYLEAETD